MKAILFVQGLGMTKHEWNNSFDEIAGVLRQAGFKTIQFDLPIFKNGETRELPLHSRAEIVQKAAAKYKPEGLLGQSYGAITSLVANLPSVKTQLFVSPALSPMKSLIRVYKERGVNIHYDGDTTLPRSSGENTTVGKEFWEDIKDFDDMKAAKNIKIPICILHGDHDSKISVATVKHFYNAISGDKMLKIYSGGDHGIVDVPRPLREEFLKDIVNWFKETLN